MENSPFPTIFYVFHLKRKGFLYFQNRRDHEEICPYKPVQCPEFDCSETRPMNEIFKHFRLEHHHHFVNAHGNVFNGDIRCDDSNMIMGIERKWAPTMMKIEEDEPGTGTQHFFLEILRTKHGGIRIQFRNSIQFWYFWKLFSSVAHVVLVFGWSK